MILDDPQLIDIIKSVRGTSASKSIPENSQKQQRGPPCNILVLSVLA